MPLSSGPKPRTSAGASSLRPIFSRFSDAQGGRIPASVRERIRARGPTTRTDLGKQAPEANVPVSAKAGLKTDQFLGFSTVR